MEIMIRFDTLKAEFRRILLKYGFSEHDSDACAQIFAINTLEGVYSHGINRFPRFISNVRDGYVKPDEKPSLIHASGAVEQWDGNLGPGPQNALFATERAMELATGSGIGMAGLANTNHWMRGGAYGWQAVHKGFILIAWTNTIANMPAWGAKDPHLGNNPFVVAVPYRNEGVVLDFAMTQFSYGKMELYSSVNKKLPFPGGYNSNGELTNDPAEVLKTWRALPAGFWKGSGLSLMLDILAAVLTGGRSTHEITQTGTEYGVSQVFIAISPLKLKNSSTVETTVHKIISDVKSSLPVDDETGVRYPGENVIKIRAHNLKYGISVNNDLWESILQL